MAVKKVTQKSSIRKNTKATTSKKATSTDIGMRDGHINEVIVTGSRTKVVNVSKTGNGEFRGDFTRDTFNKHNKYSRVLMQQGRVQVDADWNEQSSIMLHNVRNLACDIGSEHWGPNLNAGFGILDRSESNNDFRIGPGHYYVNGICCEIGLNDSNDFITYETQPDYPLPNDQTVAELTKVFEAADGELRALVYLDVWERHINYISDDSIREVALGGPDTATRSQVIWQVKVLPVPSEELSWNNEGNHPVKENYERFLKVISAVTGSEKGTLCAKVKDKGNTTDPCLVSPESRYRGAENQLYRVEIHNPGSTDGAATFKWSRENASIVFPIVNIQANTITLEHLGKDCRYGLKPNDWVELIDDDLVLQNRADNLIQVESIDTENRLVVLKNAPEIISSFNESKHPYLRRWDHAEGDERGVQLIETDGGRTWIELEDGILIKFNSGDKTEDGAKFSRRGTLANDIYKTGDYWLIPARTITGNIEWPKDNEGREKCVPAHGIIHHYAPLAIFDGGTGNDANGSIIEVDVDLRRILRKLWEDS